MVGLPAGPVELVSLDRTGAAFRDDHRVGAPVRLYLGAWAGGLVFWLLSVQWVRLTDPTAWLAWLVMASVFSVWWPAFLALARLAVGRLRMPLMMAAPILWVALEYVRAFILTGFPWYYLGHSQYRFLTLIQIADTTSAWESAS